MKKKYKDLKLMLLALYPKCEVCNDADSTDINHCLYHIHGGLYDSIENCQMTCNACNCGYKGNGNSRATKKRHWAKRVSEGYDMKAWNEKVNKWRREGFSE